MYPLSRSFLIFLFFFLRTPRGHKNLLRNTGKLDCSLFTFPKEAFRGGILQAHTPSHTHLPTHPHPKNHNRFLSRSADVLLMKCDCSEFSRKFMVRFFTNRCMTSIDESSHDCAKQDLRRRGNLHDSSTARSADYIHSAVCLGN